VQDRWLPDVLESILAGPPHLAFLFP
jgi:hypothetical protein